MQCSREHCVIKVLFCGPNKGAFDTYEYIIYIQGVPRVKVTTSGECSYVKVYRYNPKHLYPKLNGYGDNGQRSLKL